MIWWQFLVYPIAVIYDLVTSVRNYLFDKQVIKSFRFNTNVIGVGNLSVGGTGKTPMIEYLIRYFKDKEMNVATLSRGYGRKTNGFLLADEDVSPRTLGDEPYMYHYKYGPSIAVAVDEERDLAIPQILFFRPDTEVVLLDDAYQHRTVSPSLKILMTTYQRPFYEDHLMPSGLLREARRGASRSEIIVMSKCPQSLTDADMVKIKDKISHYSDAKVFFATLAYGTPMPFFDEQPELHRQVVAISGIAQPEVFHRHVQASFKCILDHRYKDHHHYSKQDVKDITNELSSKISLLTTEKDMVKLQKFESLQRYSCYYIPIKIKFLKDESLFHSIVDNCLVSGLEF